MKGLGTRFGSFQNGQLGNTESLEPVVGMGATRISYTDRSAYTVIEVGVYRGRKYAILQRDNAIRTDNYGMSDCQSYRYEPNPEAGTIKAVLCNDGLWHMNNKQGANILIGHRDEHYDYSF